MCNIPDCLESGDISTAQYHATKMHDYVEEVWACHSDTHSIPHRHYRLALDVIGDSISASQISSLLTKWYPLCEMLSLVS